MTVLHTAVAVLLRKARHERSVSALGTQHSALAGSPCGDLLMGPPQRQDRGGAGTGAAFSGGDRQRRFGAGVAAWTSAPPSRIWRPARGAAPSDRHHRSHRNYSARSFCDDALEAMRGIVERNRVPLLTGGTMLYFKRCRRAFRLPAADADIRMVIDAMAVKAAGPHTIATRSASIGHRRTARPERCAAHPARDGDFLPDRQADVRADRRGQERKLPYRMIPIRADSGTARLCIDASPRVSKRCWNWG